MKNIPGRSDAEEVLSFGPAPVVGYLFLTRAYCSSSSRVMSVEISQFWSAAACFNAARIRNEDSEIPEAREAATSTALSLGVGSRRPVVLALASGVYPPAWR
jgi:hypothetical protein